MFSHVRPILEAVRSIVAQLPYRLAAHTGVLGAHVAHAVHALHEEVAVSAGSIHLAPGTKIQWTAVTVVLLLLALWDLIELCMRAVHKLHKQAPLWIERWKKLRGKK